MDRANEGPEATGPEPAADPLRGVGDGPAAPPEEGRPSGRRFVSNKDEFMEVWAAFRQERGLPTKEPQLRQQPLNLLKLFSYIYAGGGAEAVTAGKMWSRLGRAAFAPPASMTDFAHQIKKVYTSTLLEFEEAYRSGELGIEVPLPSMPARAAAPASPPASSKGAKGAAAKERASPQVGRKRPQQQRRQHGEATPAEGDRPTEQEGAAAPRSFKRTRFAVDEGEEVTTPRRGAAQMLLDAAGAAEVGASGPAPEAAGGLSGEAALDAAAADQFVAQRLIGEGEGYKAYANSADRCYEIFALLSGTVIDMVGVRCWADGRVLIQVAAPEGSKEGEAGPLYSQVVELPGPIDTGSAQALYTHSGELYVRVSPQDP